MIQETVTLRLSTVTLFAKSIIDCSVTRGVFSDKVFLEFTQHLTQLREIYYRLDCFYKLMAVHNPSCNELFSQETVSRKTSVCFEVFLLFPKFEYVLQCCLSR